MALTLIDFLDRLRASELFTPEECAEFAGEVKRESIDDPKRLVKRLLRRNQLTLFQAKQLLRSQPRQLVLGNYILLEPLGRGGMGSVYKALHRRMKRQVALKIIQGRWINSPRALQRFMREIEATSRLEHPNIVTAHDADEAQGRHFFVMQLVDGCDLDSLISYRGPLTADQALACIAQAARGLAYAHMRGVIHRDIKPANLMLDRGGCIKLLDMGLACLHQTEEEMFGEDGEEVAAPRMTSFQATIGTRDFIAPEQADDPTSVDGRADQYSLGCSLYFFIHGNPPYLLPKERHKPREEGIPQLGAGRQDVPAWLEKIFARILANNPQDRFSSLAELLATLEKAVPGIAEPARLAGLIDNDNRRALDDLTEANPNFGSDNEAPDSEPEIDPKSLSMRARWDDALKAWTGQTPTTSSSTTEMANGRQTPPSTATARSRAAARRKMPFLPPKPKSRYRLVRWWYNTEDFCTRIIGYYAGAFPIDDIFESDATPVADTLPNCRKRGRVLHRVVFLLLLVWFAYLGYAFSSFHNEAKTAAKTIAAKRLTTNKDMTYIPPNRRLYAAKLNDNTYRIQGFVDERDLLEPTRRTYWTMTVQKIPPTTEYPTGWKDLDFQANQAP